MTTLLTLFLAHLSLATPLPKFDFTYEPIEGEAASACTKTQIQDLPDWDVTCLTPYAKKTFSAHVIVREYPRATDTGVEILYWVTEPGDKPTSPRKYHSATAFFHLKGATTLNDFSLSEGVENDQASLVLNYVTPQVRH
jgi:hypothetical protein